MPNSFINFLNHPWFPGILAAIILTWGVLQWVRLDGVHLRWIRSRLSRAQVLLSVHGNARDFARNFDVIHAGLLGNELLAPAWAAFRQTLRVNGEEPVRGHRDVREYFQFDKIVAPHTDLEFFRSVPGYLIGGGLLTTFASMTGALVVTTQGLVTTDLDQFRQALLNLLNTASLKFLISFVGIAAGMIFAWAARLRLRALTRQLDAFCDGLSACIQPGSGDAMGAFAPGEISVAIDEAGLAEEISARLNLSINALREKVVKSIQTTMRPVLEEFRQESARLTESQELSLNELMVRLDQQRRTRENDVSREFQRATTRLDQVISTLEERFAEMARDSATQLMDSFQHQTDQMLRNRETLLRQSLREMADRLAQGSASSGDTFGQVQSELAHIGDLIREMGEGLVTEVTQRLRQDVSMERVIADVRKENRRLLEGQNEQYQQAFSSVLERLQDDALLTPLLEMMQAEGKRLTSRNEELIRQVLAETTAELSARLYVQPGQEGRGLLDQPLELLEAKTGQILKNAMDELLANLRQVEGRLLRENEKAVQKAVAEVATQQSRTLQEVLDTVAVRGTDGEVSLEPMLAAVKAEGERVLIRQDELVRRVISGVVADVKAEGERVLIRQDEVVRQAMSEVVADLKTAVGSEKLARDLTRTVVEEGKRTRTEQERVVHTVLEGLEG
ncbi:MAG: hypothetical protein HQL65_13640, partial [Magnetococcales bacterium]|nr:hypothetical protein [Magnetococcales bacterium]